MKTKRFKTVILLAVAMLMIAGTNVYAQRGRNYQGQGLNQNRYCEMLPDLTEEQQTKIEALRLDHMKEMTALRNQTNELRAKKHTLMTSDNADLKEINSIIDQMTDLHNKKMKASAKHQRDIRSLLTDEQKVYFDSRPMRGHGHGKGMRGNRGHGRGAGTGQGYGRGLNPNCPYVDNASN